MRFLLRNRRCQSLCRMMLFSISTKLLLFCNKVKGDDELFQISITTNQENLIQEDLIMSHAAPSTINLKNNTGKSRRQQSVATPDDKDDAESDKDKKRLMHRELERQRRQEMASLYTNLRSLLPLEYVKGKRSISDHMTEAVNYIKDEQEKIKELGVKREELKKLPILSGRDLGSGGSSNCCLNVIVSPCQVGVEIIISTDLTWRELPLSRVLQMLLEEGFNVLSCVSTQVNERQLVYTIESEVGDQTCINFLRLQQKLNEAILSLR